MAIVKITEGTSSKARKFCQIPGFSCERSTANEGLRGPLAELASILVVKFYWSQREVISSSLPESLRA